MEEPNRLLALPAELRVLIYEYFFLPCPQDVFDFKACSSFDMTPDHEKQGAKSYSILFLNQKFLAEAYDLVLTSHPFLFRDLQSWLGAQASHPRLPQQAQAVRFDFQVCSAKEMRRSLNMASHMPRLRYVVLQWRSRSTGWEDTYSDHLSRLCTLHAFPALEVVRFPHLRVYRQGPDNKAVQEL